MAEKILSTRLKLRYDSHENWLANDPILMQGEVALSAVSIKQDGVVNEVPSVLIKVGDNIHKYSELDYAYARAADVIEQAKSTEKLTAFVNNVIASSGLATDSAMTALSGRVTTAEGKITTLEGLVGDKKVSVAIQEAITALNLADTYAAKSHTHTMTEVTGLGDAIADAKKAGTDANTALEAYKLTNDAAVKANGDAIAAINNVDTGILAQAKSYADGKDAAIAAAKKAGDDAQADVDALEAKVGTVPADKTVVEMISDAQTAATYDDTEVRGLISDNADAISDLQGLVGDTAVASQISTAKSDLIGKDTDTDASNTIAGAKKYADKLDAAMDTRVDALEAAISAGGSVGTQIDEKINALDATVETAAIAEGQDGIYVKVTEVDGKLTAVEATIEVSNEINAAKSELEGKIGTVAEGKTLAGLIADNAAAIEAHKTAVDAKVTTLIGEDADKSVRTIANEELAAQLIPEGAKESLDTLQEIAAWIQSHPDDASAMNAAIEALQTKVGDTSVSAQITSAINDLKNGDIKSAVDRIAALEADIHTHDNKAELDKIADGDKAKWDTAAGKAHVHENAAELDKFVDGDKAKLDSAVQTVTAGTGLTATKSGTDVAIGFDDSVVFVFDCGDSSNA